MKYDEIKEIKRRLRNNMTEPEKLLWKHIRNRQLLGRKFLRQHAIVFESYGNENFFFVLDFYCASEKLAIELDGKIHDFTKIKDQNRDAILLDMDVKILRIRNEELEDLPNVLDKIKACFIINDDNPAFKRKYWK